MNTERLNKALYNMYNKEYNNFHIFYNYYNEKIINFSKKIYETNIFDYIYDYDDFVQDIWLNLLIFIDKNKENLTDQKILLEIKNIINIIVNKKGVQYDKN